MATTDARLDRLALRQEALVSAMTALTDVMQQTRDMVAELAAWLQQPPSNDLPNLIAAMERALSALTEAISRMEGKLDNLPAGASQVSTANR